MTQPLPQSMLEEYDIVEVAAAWTEAINNLETENEEPVDNLFSAKQQRLLTRALYSSWTPLTSGDHPEEKRKFLADANVGVFYSPHQSPVVPDFFLSLDVEPHQDWYAKEHRSYFVWEFEKAPDVVVEIVSNRKGGELREKLRRYAQIGVTYYVVYDPQRLLSEDVIRVYERSFGERYRLRKDTHLPELGLRVTLWEGEFEGHTNTNDEDLGSGLYFDSARFFLTTSPQFPHSLSSLAAGSVRSSWIGDVGDVAGKLGLGDDEYEQYRPQYADVYYGGTCGAPRYEAFFNLSISAWRA